MEPQEPELKTLKRLALLVEEEKGQFDTFLGATKKLT